MAYARQAKFLRVPVDRKFCMNKASLKGIIEEQKDSVKYILACVASGGNSSLTLRVPLDELR
jgi:hypothetical protein